VLTELLLMAALKTGSTRWSGPETCRAGLLETYVAARTSEERQDPPTLARSAEKRGTGLRPDYDLRVVRLREGATIEREVEPLAAIERDGRDYGMKREYPGETVVARIKKRPKEKFAAGRFAVKPNQGVWTICRRLPILVSTYKPQRTLPVLTLTRDCRPNGHVTAPGKVSFLPSKLLHGSSERCHMLPRKIAILDQSTS